MERKKKKKKKKKVKQNVILNKKESLDKKVVVDNKQIEALKKEIEAANERANALKETNAVLERRTMDLSQEIDSVTQQLQSNRESMEEMNKTANNFNKERMLLESRNDEMQKEVASLKAQLTKNAKDFDKQIQRNRNNLNMKQQDLKELQKFVKELNLQNEDLLQQNDLLTKQMSALKRSVFKENPELAQNLPMDDDTMALVKALDAYQLDEEEKKMKPADLLLHRFAASEANDFRLSSEQRMKKTAKMMGDMSEDINDLMNQWLPKNKVKKDRTRSQTLVFQVRQLIGHFNVLVNQMKSQESSHQNDMRLDIKRRDKEIAKLKEENKTVHQLKDDLQEKDEMIEQLQKHRDDLRVERDHLKAQTVEQQDMIFDVQNQVRYLNTELERNRSTIVELTNKKKGNNHDQNGSNNQLNLKEILDGEEPPTSSDEDESDSDSEKDRNSKQKQGMKKKTELRNMNQSFSQSKNLSVQKSKHQKMESEEIMFMESDDDENEDEVNGDQLSMIIHDQDSDGSEDDEFKNVEQDNMKNNKNNKRKPKRRKSTMSMWRESLKPNDQLDCKDESGLWWTAKVVAYKGGNSDKLQIRYDGWGDQYDEIIERSSERLAVYKSMFHSKDKGGKKLIREGFMSKEGKMFKTWRKRYFTLDDQGKLAYYHNKGDENPIGSVDVKLMKKTERTSFGRNKQFGVQIHTDTRIWKFLCNDEKDLAEWIHAFNFVKRGQFNED